MASSLVSCVPGRSPRGHGEEPLTGAAVDLLKLGGGFCVHIRRGCWLVVFPQSFWQLLGLLSPLDGVWAL